MSNFGIQFTAWPEMLAWPYLMLQGWLPYKDIAIAHNPLLLLDLVVFFKIFGVGIVQLKIYTWILIAINTYLVYFVSIKFWNKKIAYLSSIFYLLLTIVFEGNGLWFDIALTPFALLLYYFVRTQKYLWAGIVFALGFLTKQTFVYFAIPVGIAIVQSTKDIVPRLKQLVYGFGTIAAIFVVIMAALGILDDYYNLAIKFGIFYLPSTVGQVSLPNLKQVIFVLAPFLIFIFDAELLVWAIVGSLGAYSRFELFHLQPALPFLAIAISTFFFGTSKKLFKYLVFSLLIIYLFIGIKRNLGGFTRFFESDVQEVATKLVTLNPQPHNLYVINYWDNIYALTNTLPATKPLIPYIPWYLNYGDNKNIILDDLKSEMPEAIVIGERDIVFPELYVFVDKFYTCNIVEKKVELCEKNKSK